jgi:hypothetical protein
MECRYRQHLIFPVAFFDSAIGDWTASVHIEFTEKLKIHTVVLKSGTAFQTEVQAKKFIIEQAKQWVDDRLGSTAVAQAGRKRKSSASFRNKHAMYWICGPCKNNRHDLCLKDSSSRPGTNIKIRCWCSLQPTHEGRICESSRAKLTVSDDAELGRGTSAKSKRDV